MVATRSDVWVVFACIAGPEEGKVEWSGQLYSVPYIEYARIARSSRGSGGMPPQEIFHILAL